jgi:hypothetical protein
MRTHIWYNYQSENANEGTISACNVFLGQADVAGKTRGQSSAGASSSSSAIFLVSFFYVSTTPLYCLLPYLLLSSTFV